MTYPTTQDIDNAVPPEGQPSRALVNAVLKAIIANATFLPDDGTIPMRSIEDESFSGGRIKTSTATDPDDCVNLIQMQMSMPAFARRTVATKPALPDSTGVAGDYFIDEGAIYICVATDTWRMIALTSWE